MKFKNNPIKTKKLFGFILFALAIILILVSDITYSAITATGGTTTEESGYKIHTFTSSGTFEITAGSGNIEVLVVGGGAGGGTGGTASRGGGGAGGIVHNTSYPVSAGSYTVTVGAGSAGSSGTSTQSDNGGNSSFDNLLALGGGGAGISATAGKAGGSGGGGSGWSDAAGGSGLQPASASGGYGNNGGAAMSGTSGGASGGGGGAGAVGGTGVSGQGGSGGIGLEFSQFANVGGSPAGWFGGGGGGGAASGSTAGSGGQGGGGAGSSSGVGTSGTANTGGGGGGATSTGGSGGSGIVIVKYSLNSAPSTPTSILCNGGSNCNISVGTTLNLNASGSTDNEGDSITYSIEASPLPNITTALNSTDLNLKAERVSGGWQTVGTPSTGSVAAGTSSTNVTLPFGLQQGDIVVIALANDNSLASDGILTSGYVDIEAKTGSSPGRQVSYKIMDTSPDSTVNISQEGSYKTAYVIQAWRGVDISTPIDVTSTSASGSSGDPNSPSISPTTVGSLVFTIGLVDDDGGTLTTTPSGYTNSSIGATATTGTSGNAIVVMASKIWSSSAEDPGAWALSSDDAWVAWTVALRVGSETSSETNTSSTTYDNLDFDYSSINNITVKVEVDSYDPRASVEQGTSDPDLWLEIYNGTSWISIGTFNLPLTYTGTELQTNNVNFSLTTTDSSILTAWQTSANQDIGIKGIYIDHNGTLPDEINYTNVWVTVDGEGWYYIGNHTSAATFDWDTTNIDEQACVDLRSRAIDPAGSNTYSAYFNKNSCMNINHGTNSVAASIGAFSSSSINAGETSLISGTCAPALGTLNNAYLILQDNQTSIMTTTPETAGANSVYANVSQYSLGSITNPTTKWFQVTGANAGHYNFTIKCNGTGVSANISNYSLLTVNAVTNVAPTVTKVDCNNSQTLSYTPTANKNSTLDCIVTGTDTNGYTDITSANLTMYVRNTAEVGAGGVRNSTDNYNEHYYNGSCIKEQGASNDQKFSCNLTIRYWANASVWILEAWVQDSIGAQNKNNSANVTINELLSIDVTNSSIDFGSSLAFSSYTTQKVMQVQNIGNNDTDLKLYESGGTTNGLIECTSGSMASSTYLKYNMSADFGDSGDQQTDFTEQSIHSLQSSATDFPFNFTHRLDNDGAEETAKQNLYWILSTPASGIGGTCTGTITVITTSRG